jgi:hypothetical protein
MSAQQHGLSVRLFHRREASSPDSRLGAIEIRCRVPQRNSKGGFDEISSSDRYFSGIHRRDAGNVVRGRLLQGQREMLPWQML